MIKKIYGVNMCRTPNIYEQISRNINCIKGKFTEIQLKTEVVSSQEYKNVKDKCESN